MPKLTFKEKREAQKIVAEKLAALKGGSLDFKAKREAQKLLSSNLKKLGSIISQPDTQTLPITNSEESPFTELLAGKFNGLDIPGFILKLDDAYLNESDLDKAKQSAIQYIEANRELLEAA